MDEQSRKVESLIPKNLIVGSGGALAWMTIYGNGLDNQRE